MVSRSFVNYQSDFNYPAKQDGGNHSPGLKEGGKMNGNKSYELRQIANVLKVQHLIPNQIPMHNSPVYDDSQLSNL